MTVTVKPTPSPLPATVLLRLCPPLGGYTDMKRNRTFEAGVDYSVPLKDAEAMMNEEIEPGRFVFDVSPNEKVLPGRAKVLPPAPKETMFVPTPVDPPPEDTQPPADPVTATPVTAPTPVETAPVVPAPVVQEAPRDLPPPADDDAIAL